MLNCLHLSKPTIYLSNFIAFYEGLLAPSESNIITCNNKNVIAFTLLPEFVFVFK